MEGDHNHVAHNGNAVQECFGNSYLISIIFQSLDIVELCRTSCTSSAFQEAANSSARWNNLALIERRMNLQQVISSPGYHILQCRVSIRAEHA